MTPQDQTLLALVLWREARGELYLTKQAVAWSIRNRVKHPSWWGHTWWSVILFPWQYSSFNHNDPNAVKWPVEDDPTWEDCLEIASMIGAEPPKVGDMTGGAVSYFDISLDTHPPTWATDGSMTKTLDSGRLHFYKVNAESA